MKTKTSKTIKQVSKDFFTPDCPYADKCNSKGNKCNSCKHNKKKKDYYEKDTPYIPWPQTPWPNTTPYKIGEPYYYKRETGAPSIICRLSLK